MANLLPRPFSNARRTFALHLCLLALAVLGCSRPNPTPREEVKPQAEVTLVVFAASSLSNAFRSLEPAFREVEPGARLVFHFSGTQELRTQIEQGALADVIAAADERHMSALAAKGHVTAPTVFAQNDLVIAVAETFKNRIHSFAELPLAERIVLGAPEVPIGRYSMELLSRANAAIRPNFAAQVEARVVSREHNVKQVLAKVRLGEADAAIVYKSDVAASDTQLGIVTIPHDLNVVASYPAAQLTASKVPKVAKAFVNLLKSERGQEALVAAGFTVPGALAKTP
jgi:molybdate transport system substrate-binding protein